MPLQCMPQIRRWLFHRSHFSLWPEVFVLRTLLYIKDDRNKDFISINIWEFISVIMNYCAALVAIETDGRTDDPSPVLLARCDNTSAVSWIIHAAVGSTIGRSLRRFFCALLIDYHLWASMPSGFPPLRTKSLSNSPASRSFQSKQSTLSQTALLNWILTLIGIICFSLFHSSRCAEPLSRATSLSHAFGTVYQPRAVQI